MAKNGQHYHERVIRDPAILVGKPVIKGTRIPVELILKHLAQNPDVTELIAAYPRLTIEDVKAALAYAQAVLVGDESPPVARHGATTASSARA